MDDLAQPPASTPEKGPDTSDLWVLAGALPVDNSPLPPYVSSLLSFLAELSKALLRSETARRFPDIAAFAYWCRPAHLQQLRRRFLAQDLAASRVGRGLALHIAPANIPVNFAFSFVFAALAGNANIVRVPSVDFPQIQLICAAIAELLPAHPEVSRRTAFVRYPASSAATAEFSALADIRLIWGGDATVAKISAIAKPPRCLDIGFSDRYSLAVINTPVLAQAADSELERLAAGFYNDTYLMDQNACSSPHVMLWLNSSKDADAGLRAKQRFWSAARAQASKRYQLQPRVAMDKYVQLCGDIIAGTSAVPVRFDSLLTMVDVEKLPTDLCGLRGIGGYFYQADIASLAELAPLVNDRYQTLVYYGLDPQALRQWIIEQRLRGIDRIVTFGQAMDIDIIWDGFDLAAELSRVVDAR